MSTYTLSRRGLIAGLGASLPGQAAFAGPHLSEDIWAGIDLMDASGGNFRLHQADTPLTLLNLWAHWCPACLAEMAALADLAGTIGPHRMRVLLVSHPEYWVQDQETARRRGIPLRLVTLSPFNPLPVVQAALLDQGAYAVPRTVLFRNASGTVEWRHRGAMDWRSASAIRAIRAHLG